MKASKIDGKYYAVPTAVRVLAVFYNKDLFKAAGITAVPKTWAEMEAAAKKIQKVALPSPVPFKATSTPVWRKTHDRETESSSGQKKIAHRG